MHGDPLTNILNADFCFNSEIPMVQNFPCLDNLVVVNKILEEFINKLNRAACIRTSMLKDFLTTRFANKYQYVVTNKGAYVYRLLFVSSGFCIPMQINRSVI